MFKWRQCQQWGNDSIAAIAVIAVIAHPPEA
jgi:hypothetical protein